MLDPYQIGCLLKEKPVCDTCCYLSSEKLQKFNFFLFHTSFNTGKKLSSFHSANLN